LAQFASAGYYSLTGSDNHGKITNKAEGGLSMGKKLIIRWGLNIAGIILTA